MTLIVGTAEKQDKRRAVVEHASYYPWSNSVLKTTEDFRQYNQTNRGIYKKKKKSLGQLDGVGTPR